MYKAEEGGGGLDPSDIDFPQLDIEYLETVGCGTYQLNQALC